MPERTRDREVSTTMRLMTKSLIAAVAAVSLVACATSAPREEPLTLAQQLEQKRYTVGERVDRIRDYRLSGWNSIDDEHLIIHTGPRDSYLLTLKSPCHNLRSAEHIALSTTVGSVTTFDKIIVRSHPAGFTERCLIEDMHELKRVPKTPA